jgi:hypothetical protein
LLVRRALATAAATATVLALAGCGGDDDKAADKSPSSSAPSASDSSSPADAATGDSEAAEESEGAASGEQISGDEFAGLLSDAIGKATTAHLTMDLGAVGSAEGDADYTKAPPEMAIKLTMDALGGDVEMRLVDGTMYMKSPTSGDKWIATSLDDPNSPLGSLGGSFDIKKQIEAFADAITSATYEGAEDVDGESLDHYIATVDTKKLMESLPSEAAGQAGVPASTTQEWWLDDDGLIRKFSTDLGGGLATVMTLSAWGEDVTIEAPPEDEVTTMPGATS